MTGTGAAALDHELGRFEAEARSVNHRFLKASVRVSGPLPVLDGAVEQLVKEHATRGHVSVFVRHLPSASDAAAAIDDTAFAAAAARLSALANAHVLPPPTVADVLALPGVTAAEQRGGDRDALLVPVRRVVGRALDGMVQTRRREGALLASEVERLLAAIGESVAQIEARAGDVPRALRAKLEQRMTDLLEGTRAALDPILITREAALLADRADIREEIARLQAHLKHAHEMVEQGGAVGRKLDFLVQEMHREANTIGSKSSDLDLTRDVVSMKSDVERLREQVQNFE